MNDCEAVAPTIQAEFTSSKHTHIHATCLNAIFVGCFIVQQKKKCKGNVNTTTNMHSRKKNTITKNKNSVRGCGRVCTHKVHNSNRKTRQLQSESESSSRDDSVLSLSPRPRLRSAFAVVGDDAAVAVLNGSSHDCTSSSRLHA